ncbi:MAG: AraC family transcriptional regulator, partial [Rhodococcus sp. (in: high G+C Gram-positive bacteria)]
MSKENSHPRDHRVVVIVDENSNPFELGCATEVFGLDRAELGGKLYDFRLCAPESTTRMRDGFFSLTSVEDLGAADTADTLIVPNRPDTEVPRRQEVLDAVRRAHDRGARLIGFCSGAFTLA